MSKDLRLVNTPNNIAKGRIEIDAQINKMYYHILNNIHRDNSELIIKAKKGEELTEEQKETLDKLDNMNSLQCKLTREELASILQRKNDRTKEEIDKRFNALQTAIFKFTTGEHNSTMVQLIGRVDEVADGYIVNLDAKLYKYLFYSLDVGYTPVNLATLFSLTGQYAQSLYVLLRSWTGTKREIEFTVKELREYFKLGTKYSAYKDFKRRCILQAIEEINKTGSMVIEEIKEVKKGRSINSIIFVVTDNEPRIMPVADKETPAPKTPKAPADKEPVIWLDSIRLDSEELRDRLDRRYGGDYDFNSPFIKACFTKAYEKTLRHDLAYDRIQDRKGATNWALFNKIIGDEIFIHEQSILNSMNEETSFEAELYATEDNEIAVTSYVDSEMNYDELESKLLGWKE